MRNLSAEHFIPKTKQHRFDGMKAGSSYKELGENSAADGEAKSRPGSTQTKLLDCSLSLAFVNILFRFITCLAFDTSLAFDTNG